MINSTIVLRPYWRVDYIQWLLYGTKVGIERMFLPGEDVNTWVRMYVCTYIHMQGGRRQRPQGDKPGFVSV